MNYSIETEKKWKERWEKEELYKYNPESEKEKLYVLEMFSYPSGANLHLGHWFNYGPADSYARYKMMKGYNVFHPMGFDAFGLPAENYAIKTGIHPKDSTVKNIETMKNQLKEMGANYDWDHTLETCTPDYYKWTQWLFLKLYESGLAYKKEAPVNWCTSCNTVLANEQVVDGHCERCSQEVERKKLDQWFFKITDYAEQLLDDLDTLDWPESTKKIQTNWIGKSNGTEIKFKVENTDIELIVFTTRADTLFGVTCMIIAPESDMAITLTTKENEEQVKKYIKESIKINDIERMSQDREKTGVFTGSYAINPVSGEKVPIWIGDYVLEGYGTGCIMSVPAHDERDFEFAQKYQIPIKQVIKPVAGDENIKLPFVDVEEGILINSGFLDGLSVKDAISKMISFLEERNIGIAKVNYKLKDWLVSRQRYWGAPIPIINCDCCGKVAVPEEDLPVLLPYNVEFRPDGESPLKKSKEFINCTCPKCGKPATREADTLDTFVCSSWYYLRYPDAKNSKEAWNKELIDKILPVDVYIGGKEHAAMHLIYARFITKAFRDLGYLNFSEPFKKLIHQGMILGQDGNKMSKSKGNTVSPDAYISEYGSDIFRLYLMFGFSYIDGGPWKEEGIKSMHKYLSRVEKLVDMEIERSHPSHDKMNETEKQVLFVKNRTIKAMDEDLDKFQFNTAIARLMEFLNELVKYEQSAEIINEKLLRECIETYIVLLSPLTPYFSEEQWEKLGKTGSVHKESWPKLNENELKQAEKELPIQINGKVKAVIKIPVDASKEEIEKLVKENDIIWKIISGKEIKKEFYVQNKIYSIVV